MIPLRFYTLSIFCALALLSVYFFLNRNGVALPVHTWTVASDEDRVAPAKENSLNDDYASSPRPPPVIVFNLTNLDASPIAHETPPIASTQPRPSSYPPGDITLPDILRVAVVESGGTNEETTAAIIHSFGLQQRSQLSLYLLQQRFGIGEIINAFNFTHSLAANKSSSDFSAAVDKGPLPHILISATCESDLVALHTPISRLIKEQSTYLFCVVHQPERWTEKDLTDRIRPWMDQQMVGFVTFSPHTAHFLRTGAIADWDFNATVTVQHMPPLFPVDLPEYKPRPPKKGANGQYPIAIYGDHDASRHNYSDVFTNLQKVIKTAENVTTFSGNETTPKTEARDVSLHILGERVPPDVPKWIRPFLNVDRETSFKRAYEVLSQSFVVLPAFAEPSDYLTKLASWAIPAALIAGTPIAADDEILSVYSYVPRDAVWFRYAGENEMKVAERVVLWGEDEHIHKKWVVRNRCARMIERNVELVEEWIVQAMRRVERANWRMGRKLER